MEGIQRVEVGGIQRVVVVGIQRVEVGGCQEEREKQENETGSLQLEERQQQLVEGGKFDIGD